jgi:uncharacterized protein YdgA (DUF945 family)
VLASSRILPTGVASVRKSILILLVIAAVVVLVSPGIIGRIAEESVDSNLRWAADEKEGVTVSAVHFDRGWFSSEGRHRIDIGDAGIRVALTTLAGREPAAGDPALIIDTHIDHGLIPVTSVGRTEGSLAPGLGRGISTLFIEYPDGQTIPVPGTIYSTIGLDGVLSGDYRVEAGTVEADGGAASWGDTNIAFSTDRASESLVVDGILESLVVSDAGQTLQLGKTAFAGEQRPSPFGFSVGVFEFRTDYVTVEEPGADVYRLGPVALSGTADVDGERVNGDFRLGIDALMLPGYGESDLDIELRFTGLDGKALGGIIHSADVAGDDADLAELRALLGDDRDRLLAAGLELHIDRFDLDLPQGPVSAKMRLAIEESDAAGFAISSLLLSLDAEADLTLSEEFVDYAMATNPDAGAIVGLGYLRKNGDVYELHAEYAKGLLTINGAPLPIPLGEAPAPGN